MIYLLIVSNTLVKHFKTVMGYFLADCILVHPNTGKIEWIPSKTCPAKCKEHYQTRLGKCRKGYGTTPSCKCRGHNSSSAQEYGHHKF